MSSVDKNSIYLDSMYLEIFSEGINHIPVHITAKTIQANYLRTRFLGEFNQS